MGIAIAVVLFIIACVCLYGVWYAARSDAGPFALASLLLAGANLAAGVLDIAGASYGLSVAVGILLCVYAFIALFWTWLLWDDAFVLDEYRDFAVAALCAVVLTASAVLQLAVVA